MSPRGNGAREAVGVLSSENRQAVSGEGVLVHWGLCQVGSGAEAPRAAVRTERGWGLSGRDRLAHTGRVCRQGSRGQKAPPWACGLALEQPWA